MTFGKLSLLLFFIAKPSAAMCIERQCLLPAKAIGRIVHHCSADCLPSDQPPQTSPRVITGNASSIGPGPNRQSQLHHSSDRRLAFYRFEAIPANIILALVGHAMLNGD